MEDAAGERAVFLHGSRPLSPVIFGGLGLSASEVSLWVLRYAEDFAPQTAPSVTILAPEELENIVAVTQTNLHAAHYASRSIIGSRSSVAPQCAEAAMRGLLLPYSCALRTLIADYEETAAECAFEEAVVSHDWDLVKAFDATRKVLREWPRKNAQALDLLRAREIITEDAALFAADARARVASGELPDDERMRKVLTDAGIPVPFAAPTQRALTPAESIRDQAGRRIGKWADEWLSEFASLPSQSSEAARLLSEPVPKFGPDSDPVARCAAVMASRLKELDRGAMHNYGRPIARFLSSWDVCGVNQSDFIHLLEISDKFGANAVLSANRQAFQLAPNLALAAEAVLVTPAPLPQPTLRRGGFRL